MTGYHCGESKCGLVEGNMKNTNRLLALGYTAIILVFITQSVLAQTINRTDTLDIHVHVANMTMVDINPANLTWENITPGVESNSTYAAGHKEAIQIENIGSTNITYIWFNVSHPPGMPFGTGVIANYDPGNFLVTVEAFSDSF